MKKFKVGDMVRFKSKEKLIKIVYFDAWDPKYKSLAGKVVRVHEAYEDYKSENNYYIIQDGERVLTPLFPEQYFEGFEYLVEI